MDCKFPNCKSHAQPNGYCIGHRAYASFTVAKARKSPNKKSDTRKIEEKAYKKLVKEMVAVNNRCEIKAEGCTKIAEGLHHKQKRTPNNYLNKNNLIRACNNCNTWIENNPLEAIEKGFSVSKHKKPSIVLAKHDAEVKATIIQS